ncbi:MAG: efflux transporter, family, subunit [Rhodospirillales bacterium]|jgi:membrane fusion protein (multidrug efflux system)|nr:efflux transporter, family, subunit [Rhodospirillales bacterium]
MRMSALLPLLAIVAPLLLTGCKDENKTASAPPPQVGVVTVRMQPVALVTDLPGRVTASRVADVRPQVNGVILKRLFTEGAEVKAGQQLYQIDAAQYEAAAASAKAALARAQATAAAALANYNRYKPLVESQTVSRQQYESAVAANLQGQADVASAKAALDTANINLAYTKVYAPISGRISRSSVTEGALVTANQPAALVTVTQLDPIYVDVTQPSTTLLRLKRELASGQLKRAGENQAQVQLTLEDASSYEHAGKLQFSEVTVDQSSGSVTLRAEFPNPGGLLMPGMFVRERLEEGVQEKGLLVPQQGVTHDARGEATALVVGAGDKLELRTLKTDRAIGANWLVTDGIADGEKVVVEGLQKVRAGVVVQAQETGSNSRQSSSGGNAPSGGPAAPGSSQSSAH